MIDIGYVQRMARYNHWQNQNLYGVADVLSDAERRRQRGAFFGSIHATLNHLLWADRIWMSRLAGTPPPTGGIPESISLYDDWGDLKRERASLRRSCPSRSGFWSRICSITRPITAARCIAC
jgi:uncharacterized damage-inducible protein DinB